MTKNGAANADGLKKCTWPASTTTTGTTSGTLPVLDPTKKTAGASTVGISLAAVFGLPFGLVAATLTM